MGGREHARARKKTDLKYDFSVFCISFLGSFLNYFILKIKAGNIFAKKNTFIAAIKTFFNFQ